MEAPDKSSNWIICNESKKEFITHTDPQTTKTKYDELFQTKQWKDCHHIQWLGEQDPHRFIYREIKETYKEC